MTPPDREGDAADGPQRRSPAHVDLDLEPADVERHVGRCVWVGPTVSRHDREGSRTFCRLSPRTLSASTATRITKPGKSGYEYER